MKSLYNLMTDILHSRAQRARRDKRARLIKGVASPCSIRFCARHIITHAAEWRKMLFLYIATGVLLSQSPSSTGRGTILCRIISYSAAFRIVADTACHAGQVADDCTSGFMSVDRMHAVLGSNAVDLVGVEQAVIPGINFTCSGSIESWTFGACWKESTDFIELQIWRPGNEDGSFIKVGSTTINVEDRQTDLYHYALSSPLHFQAGDIVGYYKQMILMAEDVGADSPLYVTYPDSAASQFNINDSRTFYRDQYHVLISATTGKTCIWQTCIQLCR